MERSNSLIIKSIYLLFLILLFPIKPNAASRPVLRVGGTGEDAASIKKIARIFQKKYPEIKVTIPSIESTTAINALQSDALDVAFTSRPPSQGERKKGVSAIEYARTPIVFLTSETTETGISLKQLVDIYSGRVTKWSSGNRVRLIIEKAEDTDNEYLMGLSDEMKKAVQIALARPGIIVAQNDEDNIRRISGLGGAFGASSLSQIMNQHVMVSVLRLNGIAPSPKSILDGSYPYYKCFYAVTAPHASNEAKSFVHFLASGEARTLLKKTGHIVPPFPNCTAEPCADK